MMVWSRIGVLSSPLLHTRLGITRHICITHIQTSAQSHTTSSMSGGPPSMEEIQMQQQQKAAYEERRVSILDQILEPDAKVRLQRLAIVKKEKVRAIEESLIAAATSGKLQSKVSEEQLIAMLEGADGPVATKKAAVVMQRRKYGFDEEEDDDDSDLM